jgi:sugar lactone lactonase YvrE
VFSTIYADKPWQQIDGTYGLFANLTSDAEGSVYIATGNTIRRVDADGSVTPFAELPGLKLIKIGANGRWYAATVTHEIISFGTSNGSLSDSKILTQNLPSFEDFVVTQNGLIYFVNESRHEISRIDSSGNVGLPLDLGRQMVAPSRLALSPDQSMLVVTDRTSRYSWSFQIAADGSLVNGEPFYRVEMPETIVWSQQGSDVWGAVEDTKGQVYFATPLGIQVAMQNGRISQILNPPIPGGGPLTAITFAGNKDTNWLYVVQDGKLFRRPVKVKGANAWTVVKPPKPTL